MPFAKALKCNFLKLSFVGKCAISLKKAKEQLTKVLEDTDNKVIALSGKWGTGKSHLWSKFQGASKDKKVSQALYVSLFGLSDMGQIKLKIVQIAKHSSWGSRQEMAMNSATAADFEQTIKTLDIPDLKIFMRKMLELCSQEQNYKSHFGSAMDHFAEACRNIAQDPNSSRLGELVKRLFSHAKLSHKLIPDQAQGH